MTVSLITKDDLEQFKLELIEEIKGIFNVKTSEQKLWLKSSEVKSILKISTGTLQNLRMNQTLRFSKVGGTLYYNYEDIEKLLESRNVNQIKS